MIRRQMLLFCRHVVCAVAVLPLAILSPVTAAAAESAQPYRLGVVPFFTPVRLEELYAPVAAALGKAIGHPVQFRAATSFDKYYEGLRNGDYDIAVVHAFFYVAAVDEFKYQPVARAQDPFHAVLAVAEGSPAHTLAELKGKLIATPPEYLPTIHMMRRHMKDRGFDPARDFQYKTFKTVDACLQQVVIGDAAACINASFTLHGFETRSGLRFRRVVETAPIPNLAFIARDRLPAEVQQKLRDVLVSWSASEEGRKLLEPLQTRALVPARNSDYDGVRQMLKTLDMPWLPPSP